MKSIYPSLFAASLLCAGQAWAQDSSSYTNFITQTQYPSGVEYTPSVFNDIAPTGNQVATDLEIDPGGALFELWTMHASGTEYLLASRYVGVVPVASVNIITKDMTGEIPQTRANEPFTVEFTVSKIIPTEDDLEAAKSVTPLRQEYSYGEKGVGDEVIDWKNQPFWGVEDLESLSSVGTVSKDLPNIITWEGDRFKVRGEEKISIYSLDLDPSNPNIGAQEISSQRVRIWPVADGTISGIPSSSNGTNPKIRFKLPTVTLALNDIYPGPTSSSVRLMAYKGEHQESTPPDAKEIWGRPNDSATPVDWDQSVDLSERAQYFDEDGTWTIELRTVTPFGSDELMYDTAGNPASVTFELDRSLKVNGSFTTVE